MSPGGTGGAAGAAGVGGAPDAAGAGGAAGMPEPLFMGMPCLRGESEACVCEDGVSMGSRACLSDPASPTGGVFAECARCVMPEVPEMSEAGSGGAAGADAGAGGGGGGGSGGSAAGGSGGSAVGGSGGSGGSGGGSRCDPATCDEPLIGQVCCTSRGECGYRLLLSCNRQL
jgi:hypothetical protein